MKRILSTVLSLGLMAMACGNGSDEEASRSPSVPATAPASRTAPASAVASPTPAPRGTLVTEEWFAFMTGGSADVSNGPFLFQARRSLAETITPASAAMTALLAGPSEAEKAAGLTSAIPEGTRLLGLDIENGTATVDLSSEFESGGGTTSVLMRLAQVVYTLTQFPTVERVEFKIDGKPVRVFSGEGVVLDHPQTRDDFADQLPPILVESPAIGETVSSPISVSGTADVFEATVSMRVLDADGNVIRSATTTARCGSGCRGTFKGKVPFDVASTQQGTLEVFEASAKDGQPMFVVSIPVMLAAA